MQNLIPLLEGKKHVVWDWNGTLMSDVDHAVGCVNVLLNHYQLPLLTRERYLEIFAFPVEGYYRELGFDFDKVSFDVLAHDFYARYMDGFRGCELQPSARETLDAIKALGIEQSILSAAEHTTLQEMVEHYGIAGHFRRIQGIQNRKAESKVAQGLALIDSSPFSKTETILIGDTDHDLEVGRELGIDVVLIAHGHQSPDRLRRFHDSVIERF